MRCLHFTAGVGLLVASSAAAQDLVYTPVNPSFGGNPGYSGHLLATASAQRSQTSLQALERQEITGTTTTSDADLFIRQLESRLLSDLSRQVSEAIFGEASSEAGSVVFGTTTISFDRDLTSINLLITDELDGSVTEISVPQLVLK